MKQNGYTIFLLLAAVIFNVKSQALTGSWRGELSIGGTSLPLVLNFTETNNGITQCSMDSPAQGAKGIPMEVTLCSADSVRLVCRAIGATYEGRIEAGTITGTFAQSGFKIPLIMKPDTPVEERRPQTPHPPYPYSVTDTTFRAPDGALMSATLAQPAGTDTSKCVPAVVFVTGSGPQNRDEELMDHKPFAVIADFLARNGVASLRYDDRGTARSQGDFATSTTYTFRDDARSAIEFMRTLPGIGQIGVIGHSEGGTIAFLLAGESIPDFIISLAGMACTGKETILRQNGHSFDRNGIAGKQKDDCMTLITHVIDIIIKQARTGSIAPIDFEALATELDIEVPEPVMASLKQSQGTMRTPWFNKFLTIDPSASLKTMRCPALAINGDKDMQVDAHTNIAVINRYAPHAETRIMPGLNHLLQHAGTGEVDEYEKIRETISPEVLDIILSFIRDL